MMEIRKIDTCYIVVNDNGRLVSDPFLTIEEAERALTDWHLTDELEQELLNLVVDWAGKKGKVLGRTRKEIVAMVRDFGLADYGSKGL